jgi:DNA-binding IclR family transcriptional regulator
LVDTRRGEELYSALKFHFFRGHPVPAPEKEKAKTHPPGIENRSGAQSLHRAISLIRAVARHNDAGSTLSKLAREAGLHVATVHRMLSVLSQEGLVFRDPVSRHYHLGIDLFLLAGAAQQFTLRHQFRTTLEKIAQETGDTVFLLIRSGNDALCLDRVEGKSPIRTVPIDIGVRRPLGIGAGSLALIAFSNPEQVEPILRANARRYPQFKKLTREDIQSMAARSRQTGYVVSEGLFHEGVTSVGIPVFRDHGETIAAITVSSISQRMGEKRRREIYQLVKKVLRAEDLVSSTNARDRKRSRNSGA